MLLQKRLAKDDVETGVNTIPLGNVPDASVYESSLYGFDFRNGHFAICIRISKLYISEASKSHTAGGIDEGYTSLNASKRSHRRPTGGLSSGPLGRGARRLVFDRI